MTVQSSINDAARRYLRSMDLDVDEVISVDQETQTRGVCETCRHDEIVVVISYVEHGGRHDSRRGGPSRSGLAPQADALPLAT